MPTGGGDTGGLDAVFEPSADVVLARLERQLDGMRIQLRRRIDDAEKARAEAAELRLQVEPVTAQLRSTEASLRGTEAQLSAMQTEYHALLNTRTFRLLARPRGLYARARPVIRALQHARREGQRS